MFRIGQGFDLHRLVAGRKLILGGIEIPYEYGLAGHSDADVLIHAIIDALIGAVALGDIGKLFPDNDSKFKDIDSTIILEQPKLRDYIDLMRASLAKVLDLRIDQISIKAKTSEKIGVVGRGEAAIAEAVVLLIK
jgi:2C-methyl-D-erythritol 2,4-cyclodiphosphate synthase